MYTPSGQKLGEYLFVPGTTTQQGADVAYINVTISASDQYFGGRRLAVMDQLGSAGTYFPWGEDKGSTNPQDIWSYATYWRDSISGLDYANNRYYSNAYGRFMTPDPYSNSGRLDDPQGWNRYAYTRGDPVNRIDPWGRDDCTPSAGSDFCVTGTSTSEDDGGVPPNTDFDPGGPAGGELEWWEGEGQTQTTKASLRVQLQNYNNVMKKLPNVVGRAERLLDNPQCDSIFGVGKTADGGTIDAGLVLFDLFNGIGGYGGITAGPIAPPQPGLIVNASTTPGEVQNAQGNVVSNFAEIILNDTQGTFVTGNLQSQIVTLLHELGHAMNDIFGPGTNSFNQNDYANVKASGGNDQMIIDNCLK